MKLETAKRLHDAMSACREIEGFTAGRRDRDIRTDRALQLSLHKLLEIVGEALNVASRTDPSVKAAIPEIRRIVDMRNLLTHVYAEVDYDAVWRVSIFQIPPLRIVLEELLKEPLDEA